MYINSERVCVCRERGAGSPREARAQCKVIREAFHGHREGILGLRDGANREGGSLGEQDSIFISIPVFIVSLWGGGRSGRGFGYAILSDCLRTEETERESVCVNVNQRRGAVF